MKSVSRFEANLVRIVRCFVRQAPLEHTLPLVLHELPRPRCLSRAAIDLVQESLATGTMLLVARWGWRRERFLREGKASEGRLWQRTPLVHRRLSFSRASLEWLVWITAVNPSAGRRPPAIDLDRLTTGDRLLFFLAFDRLHDTPAAAGLLRQKWFARHALVHLAFPDRLAENEIERKCDFTPWLRDDAVWLLEALQGRLAERWLLVEQHKQHAADGEHVRRIGLAQERAAAAFLEAVHAAGRWELASFLLEAARRFLDARDPTIPWFARLDTRDLRLADRAEVYRAGLALLHQLPRLKQWEQQARAIGFYDDEYAISQLWKSDWERRDGESLCARADEVVRNFRFL